MRLALALVLATGSALGATRVQSTCVFAASNVITVDLPNAVTAGDTLVVAITINDTTGLAVMAVNDDRGSVFTRAAPANQQLTNVVEIFSGAAVGGVTRVSVTFNGAPPLTTNVFVAEYLPLGPPRAAALDAGNVSFPALGPITRVAPDELIFGAMAIVSGSILDAGVRPSGFDVFSVCTGDFVVDQLAGAPGPQSESFPSTTLAWVSTAIAFDVADAGVDGGVGANSDGGAPMPNDPRQLDVACGCSSADASLLVTVALIGAWARRLRGVSAHSTVARSSKLPPLPSNESMTTR